MEKKLTKTHKTFKANPRHVEQKWNDLHATDKVVGRLASDIAMILMGKHRPTYTPHVDTGDYVIVLNADKVKFTGRKWDNKRYTWTTGYPGLRSETAGKRLERRPELIIHEDDRRMLPNYKLAV